MVGYGVDSVGTLISFGGNASFSGIAEHDIFLQAAETTLKKDQYSNFYRARLLFRLQSAKCASTTCESPSECL